MAIVVPMRKKYKPRNLVEAVVDNVLRLRSNCKTMTNPNTQAQQYVRSRFKLMQELQKGLSPLLRRGFDRKLNARERWVGAYHVALGYNMSEAAHYHSEEAKWECDFSRFSICEHRSRAPKKITVQRKGYFLIMSYVWKGQAECTSLLWAVYNRKRNAWVQGIHDTRLDGKVTACVTPSAWQNDPLEVLIGFGRDAQGRGKLRGTHHFSFGEGEGIITVRGGIRRVQSFDNQGNIHASTSAVTVWQRIGREGASWVDIGDAQGVTLRVEVLYLME